MALFVQLDTAWPDNVKIIRVGLEGAGLHAIAMCIAKRTETDGVLHRAQLHRVGASDELIDLLIDEGLFDPVEYGSRAHEDPNQAVSFRVHDWHDRNPSQGAIAANRTAKAEAAQRGNHKRWAHQGKFEDCPVCHADKPSVLASDRTSDTGAIADAKRVRSPESESESETKTESLSSDESPDDGFAEFWDAYPRKEAKKKAAIAWRNLPKKDRVAVMDALPARVKAWSGRDREHILLPTTFLHGRRWEDELKDNRKKPGQGEVDGGGYVGGDW